MTLRLCNSRLIQKISRPFSTTQNVRASNEIIDRDDDPSIIIPIYEAKSGESLDTKKARLLYQSRKRGMLENGLILSTFAAKHLDGFNEQETTLYDKLINQPSNDWDIFGWATGTKETPEEYNNQIMELLKSHVKNFASEVSTNKK